MEYDVEYDAFLGCFVMLWADEVICLGAETEANALEEASNIFVES